jgi:hypothetical protein
MQAAYEMYCSANGDYIGNFIDCLIEVKSRDPLDLHHKLAIAGGAFVKSEINAGRPAPVFSKWETMIKSGEWAKLKNPDMVTLKFS